MKKKYVKNIIIILAIILLLGTAGIVAFLGIQRQKHIAELEQVELPEIVFLLGRKNQYGNYKTKIIDSKGCIYFFNGSMNFEDILQKYNSGELQKKWERIGTVNDIELKEKYVLFLEIKNNPNYEIFYDKDVPKGISSRLTWYGCYYSECGERELYKFYERDYVAPNVTDERGKELAGWISDVVNN